MARGSSRPERRPGRQSRESVPANPDLGLLTGFDDPPDEPPTGGAGVREPRHPEPGPLSGAGAKPLPQEFLLAVLPDSRR